MSVQKKSNLNMILNSAPLLPVILDITINLVARKVGLVCLPAGKPWVCNVGEAGFFPCIHLLYVEIVDLL